MRANRACLQIIRLKQVDHIKSEVRILGMIQHPFIVNMCVRAVLFAPVYVCADVLMCCCLQGGARAIPDALVHASGVCPWW